jgi:hypothetical protein
MENEQDDKKSRIRIRQTITYNDAMALGIFCKSHPIYGVSLKVLEANEIEQWAEIQLHFRADTRINFNRTIVSFFVAYANWIGNLLTSENPN